MKLADSLMLKTFTLNAPKFSATRGCCGAITVIRTLVTDKTNCLLLRLSLSLFVYFLSISMFYLIPASFCLWSGLVIYCSKLPNYLWSDVSCGRRGRMGCVAPAVPSKLGWIPRHCWKNGVKPPLFLFVSFVLSATPQTGGNGQGI